MKKYKQFADLDATFKVNPITRDLGVRTDEAAIKFAVKNLVLTRNFERPFDSSIGSQMYRFLFEPIDATTVILMKQVITRSIVEHEPRVDVGVVNIVASEDKNEVVVTINFKIKNTEKPLNITLALDRTR